MITKVLSHSPHSSQADAPVVMVTLVVHVMFVLMVIIVIVMDHAQVSYNVTSYLCNVDIVSL